MQGWISGDQHGIGGPGLGHQQAVAEVAGEFAWQLAGG
jgi:hypothetical protein